MNNPRRIQRHLVKALAAGALLAAAALPMAIATAAGAAAPPVLTHVYLGATGTAPFTIGAGASGTVNFTGTGFANDGGNVSLATTATGVTFSSAAETSTTAGTASFTSTASTPPGTYGVTLTDDNGTSTATTLFLTVDADPTVSGISITSVAQGQTSAAATITGTGFATGTTASFTTTVNGTSLENTFAYATATTLTGTVSGNVAAGSNPVAVVGTYNLTVTNADGGSAALGSGVTVTASGITNVSPSEVSATAGTYPVTISGAGFEAGAVVTVSVCTDTTVSGTTVVSPSSITTGIVEAGGGAGSCTVTVTNPSAPAGNGAVISLATALGVGVEATGGAAISSTALSPNAPIVPGTSGTTPETLTITGTGFGAGTTVQAFNGTTHDTAVTFTTSVNSAGTVITANVVVGSGAIAGVDGITVTNNGVASAESASAFTVAGPAIVSASPSGLAVGAAVGTVVTLTGTGFTSSATLVNPSGGTSTAGVLAVTSPTTATFTVTTSPAAVGTGFTFQLSQTVSAGVTVVSTPFTIKIDALPTIASIVNANTKADLVGAGATAVPVVITGTGFNAGATVGAFVNAFGVADSGVTFTPGTVTSTTITGTVTIAATDTNTADGYTVTNTDGGVVKVNGFSAASLYIAGAPTITSVTPATGAASSTTSFAIAGTNFAAGAVVTLSPANGTCGVTTVSSSTTIAVTCTLGLAGVTPTSLVVTNLNGGSVTSSPVLASAAPAAKPFHVSGVHGAAVAGKWVTVQITGTGFYGQPKITSTAAGSKFAVTKDTGTALTVKIWTKAGLKGEHVLTVRLANGKSGKAGYNIKA